MGKKCLELGEQRMDIAPLVNWFLEQRRDLPWRAHSSPYAVWVSEVMLQQTQVSVVIPYFNRWMRAFPTIESLASASEDEVVKLWEGLGYYSRARNLHQGAKKVLSEYGGEIPSDRKSLEGIKGFGPYTAGAVLSFAFHKRAAAVDGNVLRVISRLYSIGGLVSQVRTKREVEKCTLKLLPKVRPWEGMEALIELGALICKKKPNCLECPMNRACSAFQNGEVERFPNLPKRKKCVELERDVAIYKCNGYLLVRREPEGVVMAGLYQFPYEELGLTGALIGDLPRVTHTFTHHRAILRPSVVELAKYKSVEGYEWVSEEDILKLPFSSGHRKLLHHYLRSNYCAANKPPNHATPLSYSF